MLKLHSSLFLSLLALGTIFVLSNAHADQLSPKSLSENAVVEYPFGHERDNWFGIFFKQRRVGYMHHRLQVPKENSTLISSVMKKQIQIEGGLKVSISEELLFSSEAPYPLVEGSFRITRGTESSSLRYSAEEQHAVVTRITNGTERETKSNRIEYGLSDYLAVERCVHRSARPCSTESLRALELKNLKLLNKRVRVEPLSTKGARIAPSALYEATLYSEDEETESKHYLDAKGHPVVVFLGGDFRAVREEKSNALEIRSLPRPKQLAEVKVDQTLKRPDSIKRLVLEVDGPLPTLIETSVRQKIQRLPKANNFRLETNDTSEMDVSQSEQNIDEYLGETLDYPVHDPEIVALSRRIVDGAYSDSGKVVRLLRFVSQHLKNSDQAHLSVLKSLKRQSGNCRDHARLFTTLARAAGIPTREVAGLVYSDDTSQSFSPHSWNEVLIAGRWLSIDPTFNKQKLNPTYISFGVGRDGLHNLIRAIGKISLRVVQISYHEV